MVCGDTTYNWIFSSKWLEGKQEEGVRREVENKLSATQTRIHSGFEASRVPIMALNIRSEGKAAINCAHLTIINPFQMCYLDQKY
jgi:hypothetical protein